MKPKIAILTTGGTIASRFDGPMLRGDEVLSRIQRFFPEVNISIDEICRIGSSQMTIELLWEMGKRVKKCFLEGASGVVVTHGTDTLEESAYFLDLIAGGLGPIVVTGAMRSDDAVAPDGMANLVESCRVTLESESSRYGVLVVMNDRIHTAREVMKVHSWLLDAFASPGSGPVGFVGREAVTFVGAPLTRSRLERDLMQRASWLVTPVDLVKACLDSGDRLVRAAAHLGAKGLIVESLGNGHLPPGVYQACLEIAETEIPVVMTTRCLCGGARMQTEVKRQPPLISTDLAGVKARIKLMLALSVTSDLDEIAEIFSDC